MYLLIFFFYDGENIKQSKVVNVRCESINPLTMASELF